MMEVLSYLKKENSIKPVQELSNHFFKAIEKAMDGIGLLDSEGKFYYLNNSYVKILGYQNQKELLGKSWNILYEEKEINRINQEIYPLLLKDKQWKGYTYGIRKDKTPIIKELSLTLLEDNGFICICREIDYYRKRENALLRLSIVAEKTSSLVLVADNNGAIVWTNKSLRTKLDLSFDEIKHLKLINFLQAKNISKRTFVLINRSLKKNGVFVGEVEFLKNDSTKIFLYIDFTAIYDDQGKLVNYVAVNHDITPIKTAEEQLKNSLQLERQLNQFKTQFTNIVSHQFRTPLATIRIALDILEINLTQKNFSNFHEVFHKYRSIMTKETLRMVKLLENILELGRIDENKIILLKKKTFFKKYLDQFIENFKQVYEDKRKIQYSFRAPDICMQLDEIIITNILENIISNAFKYSKGKQDPELDVTYQDSSYFITIKDYGIGIPDNDKKFLFQSFFRANNAKSLQGSGLGLLIAKRLINLHGGDISIQSQLNTGTTVTIQLPT